MKAVEGTARDFGGRWGEIHMKGSQGYDWIVGMYFPSVLFPSAKG